MHPRTRTTIRVRQTLLAALLSAFAASASAQAPAAAAPASFGTPSLKELFEAAWSRQPSKTPMHSRFPN